MSIKPIAFPILFAFLFTNLCFHSYSQEIPIIDHVINEKGQIEITVNSSKDQYYILQVKHDLNDTFKQTTSLTLGEEETTKLTESLNHYPIDHYRVLAYDINSPMDIDNDGINDIVEYENQGAYNPLNAAKSISENDGAILLKSFEDFKKYAIKKDQIQWSEFLNGKEFVKFIIVDGEHPETYFIHSSNHNLHEDFANQIGIDFLGDNIIKGQIIYHPATPSNNGSLGTFAFNYSNGHPKSFEIVRKTNELLATNMPFIENNLSYYVTQNSQEYYEANQALFDNSRVAVLTESDLYADVDYWGLHHAEGYGYFKEMQLEEIPGSRDIVLYKALPNSLPRVGGIMTSVVQTPLSHVNLRAIHNDIPNAFIRDPLQIDSIKNLLDHYIYFRVEEDNYFIREATLEEVNQWYADLRPKEDQNPPLNLEMNKILPLDDITFDMYDAYGAKCTNIATMRSFGFPDNTIPDGFGIPFYYYQEFMKYNQFFKYVENMISDPTFLADREERSAQLKKFRKKIKKAQMPVWMIEELTTLQSQFPEGTSIRCRSSSNNEDLVGFNGAGLYDSKTQHPDEGHISKSVKQVYASLWNLRAFEERSFYRINHYISSMGVLCHPNYTDEKANGVGVTRDPIYETSNTFYINTQLGEDLITNPAANSIPEEILIDQDPTKGFLLVQRSNLVPFDSMVVSVEHLQEMRAFMQTIHQEFKELYHAKEEDHFAMDIEFKITAEDQLIIKQARPWVDYTPSPKDTITIQDSLSFNVYPNPTSDDLIITQNDLNIDQISIYDLSGKLVRVEKWITEDNQLSFSLQDLAAGLYIIQAQNTDGKSVHSTKIIKINSN